RAGARPSPRFAPAPGARDAHLDLFVIGSEAGAADALLLACYRGARVLEPFARRGARWQRIVAGQRQLRKAALGEAEPPSAEALRALGVDLFETLLPGDARRLYDEARGAEPQLELRVTSTLDWVADAPWELAFDPRRGCALVADAHLARGVYSAIPADRPRRPRGPLRVLVVTASPRELPALSLVAEQRALQAALAPGALAGRVKLDVLARATPDALAERLDAAPCDVVHFVGHGEHDVSGGGPGRLVFEDGRGGVHLLDAAAVRALLAGRGLGLVFVNACESGLHGRGDLARGVGPELARAGVPAVVAHQSSVLDASALRFARAFYESLARGRALAAAAAEARRALRLADHGAGYDWATPVVFLRT
ncbi:MAG: CHAT domain-containing protein, partial [Vicinamibacteria bacterium]|nr:CHAT domain-containing protein [Vicinamibacteria bacterium]